jgi:Cu+-exporting ATPase
MEKVSLEVSGMHCTACAVSVEKKILESGGGSIHVNFTTGEATFDKPDDIPLQQIMKGIESLEAIL